MHYIELLKRIVPFFLTFAIGLVITSFIFAVFAFVSPSNVEVKEVEFKQATVERNTYKYRKNCRKWKRIKRERKERMQKLNLEVPPPPPAPPAPPAPPVAPEN